MTEVRLCDRIRAWAEALGFVVYPEVCGWDLVLVARDRVLQLGRHAVSPGEQVGIHAKSWANYEWARSRRWPPRWWR